MAFDFIRGIFGGKKQERITEKEAAPGTVDAWLEDGSWLYTASSDVEAIRYIIEDQLLEVEFKTGSYYQYFDVPPEVAKRFYNTDSPGRFVWSHLRDVYPFVLLSGPSRKVAKDLQKPTVVRARHDLTASDAARLQSGIIPPKKKR